MYDPREIEKIIVKAEHYLALQMTEIHLWTRETSEEMDDLLPWGQVASAEPGGLHRYNIAVSINLKAPHPCGITFCWTVDIETSDANGTSGLRPANDRIAVILAKLPEVPRAQVCEHLEKIAQTITTEADRVMLFAKTQYGQAEVLRRLMRASRRCAKCGRETIDLFLVPIRGRAPEPHVATYEKQCGTCAGEPPQEQRAPRGTTSDRPADAGTKAADIAPTTDPISTQHIEHCLAEHASASVTTGGAFW